MKYSEDDRLANSGRRGLPQGIGECTGLVMFRALVFTVVAGIVLACTEDLPTTPHAAQMPRLRLHPEIKALPAVITSLSSAPGGSVFLANYPYPERVLAELRIDGTISMTSHANAWYSSYNGPLDARGIFIYGPFYSCYMQVKIGGLGPACKGGDVMGSQASWVDTALVTGNVHATRGYAVPWLNPSCSASGDPCHTYSGLQAITLNPLPAEFKTVITGNQFRPVPFSLYWNSTVTPNSAHGIGMPLRMVSRVWVKADPADSTGAAMSPACSLIERSCGGWVPQAGTLIETARANGVQHLDSVEIYCPDSMPLLNHIAVRRGMRTALFDSAGYPNKSPNDRVEHAFFILQDTVTPGAMPYVDIKPATVTSDGCGVDPPHFNQRPPNTKVLAWGHTHPNEFEDSFCKDSNGLDWKRDAAGNPILFTHLPGASDADVNMAYDRADPSSPYYVGPIDHFIVSPYALRIIKPSRQMRNAVNKLAANNPRVKTGKCAWPGFN